MKATVLRWSLIVGFLLLETSCSAANCLAEEVDSAGNTDGVLTWRLGTLEKDKPVREVVVFTYDDSLNAVVKRLDALRQQFASLPAPPALPADAPSLPEVWIENSTTDFVLQAPAFFRWDWTKRQSLRSARGGQLSQFTWYVHYRDAGANIAPVCLISTSANRRTCASPSRYANSRQPRRWAWSRLPMASCVCAFAP